MSTNILIYVVRRDLRVADNPILHHLATHSDHGFTHLLPVYIVPAHQMETSGFVEDGKGPSPYPEARSPLGGYRRCGPFRAKFVAEALWDLKCSLEALDSGMLIRVGLYGDAIRDLIQGLQDKGAKVGALWMTRDVGVEEVRDEKHAAKVCKDLEVNLKLWADEKYYIHDDDLPIKDLGELPDIFTEYRKKAEPLRDIPRAALPRPEKSSLPPFPNDSIVPAQRAPFKIPDTLKQLLKAMVDPVTDCVKGAGASPEGVKNAHPFEGGETQALARMRHLLEGEGLKDYKTTRNELLGTEFSTKLSTYLAQGNITARQIHHYLAQYEDGTNEDFANLEGYGKGENPDTAAVRYHMLWRDYMRLCANKFKQHLFRLDGFAGTRKVENDEESELKWASAGKDAWPDQDPGPDQVAKILEKFRFGKTGMGLIDASQRELLHTGYTSNRARQNVASFLAKHLGIDWRYGAEWYEMLLVDYDVASNWANWQYVAGVGNDPRGKARIFNPVKQAYDYDKNGDYIRAWVPELRHLEHLDNVFQPWTTPTELLREAGLEGNPLVTDPVKKIQFAIDRKPRSNRRPYTRRNRGARSGAQDAPHVPIVQGNGDVRRSPLYNNNNNSSSNNSNNNNTGSDASFRGTAWRSSPGQHIPQGPRALQQGYHGGYQAHGQHQRAPAPNHYGT